MTLSTSLFREVPSQLADELVSVLASSDSVRIERIVSTGHRSADGHWYDQAEHEWVAVLRGAAVLHFDDDTSVSMGPGDHVLIPAHRRHRVESTSETEPTVWLAVFFQ